MKKLVVFFWLWSLSFFWLQASAPLGYYNSAEGKKAAALKTELHTILCQDTSRFLGYGSGAGNTWEGFYYTDRNRSTNAVIDMYSDSVRYFPNPNPNFVAFGQTIHIEHSVPKSWWGCDITHPDCAARDLNHLFPADGSANTSKNDNPLGVVSGTPTFNNGVSKIGQGAYDGYVGTVFEPADQYKGDFARAYFYMATMYEHYQNKWDINKPENMMQQNRYPVLKPWAIALLLQWHRQDPVSTKETTRNDVVYGLQGNRNPFVDYPALVEYIWGDRTTIPFRLDGNINFPYLKWPSTADTLKLGKVYCLHTKDTTLRLQAMNITGDLTLSLSGTDAALFSLDKRTITASEALAGCSIGLHCSASLPANIRALLTISGGGITPVISVIQATATNEFAALQPTNAGLTSFVAEWTASPGATGYLLNVFTRQKTTATNPLPLIDDEFPLSFPASWAREGYTEYVSGTMRLASGSNYGKITTPAIDLSVGTSLLTVRAKQYGSDAGAKLTALLDGQQIASWTMTVANDDYTVEMPVSSTLSKISLSAIAGKRVYVDKVKVVANIPVFGSESVTGYPISVGNVLSYSVTGLQSGLTYYYTVTPEGNNAEISNQIVVKTLIGTAVESAGQLKPRCFLNRNVVHLENAEVGSEVALYTIDGTCIQRLAVHEGDVRLILQRHGVYVLRVSRLSQSAVFKIIW